MSFYRARESETHIIVVVGVARETIWFQLSTQKGGVWWVRGRLFYPYLSIIFNIFSGEYCLCSTHTVAYVTTIKKKPIFQLISNWVFRSFINIFPTYWNHPKYMWNLFHERCAYGEECVVRAVDIYRHNVYMERGYSSFPRVSYGVIEHCT
jgi:hypothetical protein